MNTRQLELYAPLARQNFIAAIKANLTRFGVNGDKDYAPLIDSGIDAKVTTTGEIVTSSYKGAYNALLDAINKHGYEHICEEVAYTWFNRFIAIRYMEVNNYLSHRIRILSNLNQTDTRPQIVYECLNLPPHELGDLDRQQITQLYQSNQFEMLYQKIILAQCNQLHEMMPQVFGKINDYVALLIPTELLKNDSVVNQLVSSIDEESFKQVEVIGWLYQYYITERKSKSKLRLEEHKGGYTTDEIPSVTQLFTPNWIVKYMVQNSLGATWLASTPYSQLKQQMEYYIEPAQQSEEVRAQIKAITPDYIDPSKLTILDPACGSGHILVEAYQLLKQIYLEEGYQLNQIPQLILKNNLFGLEIDERATQLANFALIMQARADDSNLFASRVTTNIVQIKPTDFLNKDHLYNTLASVSNFITQDEVNQFVDTFNNADMFGSLIQISPETLSITNKIAAIIAEQQHNHNDLFQSQDLSELIPFIIQAKILANTYDCVIANPPYMASSFYNKELKRFIDNKYSISKADLFSAFVERCIVFNKLGSFIGVMSPFNWMFINKFENFRQGIYSRVTMSSMVDLEHDGFEAASVHVCTYVLRNICNLNYRATYIRLNDFYGPKIQHVKTLEAINNRKCGWLYEAPQSKFAKLPGSPIAYWVSDKVAEIFATYPPLSEFADARNGITTADTNKFLKLWHEVSIDHIKFDMHSTNQQYSLKWYPYNKGGEFRKWYGNQEYVVNWHNDGEEIRGFVDDKGKLKSTARNIQYFFRECNTWSSISSSYFGTRYSPSGFAFDCSGNSAFPVNIDLIYSQTALMCSSIVPVFLSLMNPTLNYTPGNVAAIPTKLVPSCEPIVKELIELSKSDWDRYETSWNFVHNPLVAMNAKTLDERYTLVRQEWQNATKRMKELEEDNNRLHIEAYDLADEFSPEVADNLVTLSCNPQYRYKSGDKEFAVADLEARLKLDSYKELISYAIGCILGRYSLDYAGLAYAGGEWVSSRYQQFIPSSSNVLPITSELFFIDDATRRLEEFIKTVFSADPVASFYQLAQTIKASNSETSLNIINSYLLAEFYKDHTKMYQKKPIYWLFSSGKQKAFQALVYMHRLNSGTLSKMRVDYIYPLLEHYRHKVEELAMINAPSKAQTKLIGEVQKKLDELRDYDQKLEHLINSQVTFDLDDGVTVNYAKFATVVDKIK